MAERRETYMLLGASCISHTPFMDRARADREVEEQFFVTAERLAAEIAELNIDTVVVIHPDHYNGFFYNFMPAFCIGIQARSIGDYGTVEGELPVDSEMAQDLAASCLNDGVDIAFAYRMEVDHGFAQPFEMMFAGATLPKVIPVMINCVAAPRPTFARARKLGEAIGRWAVGRPERIYVLASGGLSHDPPMPSLNNSSEAKRLSLIEGGRPSYTVRLERQSNVYAAGKAHVSGRGEIKPINEEFDRSLLQAMAEGRLGTLDSYSTDALTALAGCGAHEVRTWIAALSALKAVGEYSAELYFYVPIQEWITGTALLKAANI